MEKEQKQKSLEFRISNQTRGDTLAFHRLEQVPLRSPELNPELPAGNSDCCQIFRDPNSQAIKRLVLYSAESFTLAIFIHMPRKAPGFLQLELSREQAHLRDLDQTFSRMSKRLNPPEADRAAVTACEFSGQAKVSVWLLTERYKVTATVSHYTRPLLKVELQELAMA